MTTTERPRHAGPADECAACVHEFGGPVQPEHDILAEIDAEA